MSLPLTLTGRLVPGPAPVRAAAPGGVADQRVAVVALVRHDRIVGLAGEDGPAVGRVLRGGALNFCNHSTAQPQTRTASYLAPDREPRSMEKDKVRGREEGQPKPAPLHDRCGTPVCCSGELFRRH